jgi:hypothetical protein
MNIYHGINAENKIIIKIYASNQEIAARKLKYRFGDCACFIELKLFKKNVDIFNERARQ